MLRLLGAIKDEPAVTKKIRKQVEFVKSSPTSSVRIISEMDLALAEVDVDLPASPTILRDSPSEPQCGVIKTRNALPESSEIQIKSKGTISDSVTSMKSAVSKQIKTKVASCLMDFFNVKKE